MQYVYLLPSDPSATSQLASFFTPTSFNSTDIGTPAHSLQLMMPWVYWTVTGVDPGLPLLIWRRGELLPRHSRKRILDTEGRRFRSSRLNIRGRSPMPWMVRLYLAGWMYGRRGLECIKWIVSGVVIPPECASR